LAKRAGVRPDTLRFYERRGLLERELLGARLRDVNQRIAQLESLRETLSRALARSHALPLIKACVCEIIESQEVGAALRPTRDGGRSRVSPRKEAL
jgi:DNA-binding transcriptional MerR regulator